MRIIPAVLVAATCLAGCSGTDTSNSTMALLRAGDAKLCVAQDVEDSLRQLILPDGDAEAAKTYTVSFDNTTMEQFDRSITKLVCNTYLKVETADAVTIERTPLDYAVSPSAQNAATFIVTAPTAPLRQRLTNDYAERSEDREHAAELKAAESRLAALVKPGWLMGAGSKPMRARTPASPAPTSISAGRAPLRTVTVVAAGR